jgi:hypothetical protein
MSIETKEVGVVATQEVSSLRFKDKDKDYDLYNDEK